MPTQQQHLRERARSLCTQMVVQEGSSGRTTRFYVYDEMYDEMIKKGVLVYTASRLSIR